MTATECINFSFLPSALSPVTAQPPWGYNMPMSRSLSTVLALVLLLAPAFSVASASSRTSRQVPDSPADDALRSGITHLEQTEYADALKEFDRALDLFAAAQRLEDARRAYMQLFVSHRSQANMLMKAMKTWVEKRRSHSGGLAPGSFVAFDTWVQERDALAAATINLVHNSPDWK
jgi:hypothetical protein